MDPFRELPMGFGMALVQNQPAAQYFESLSVQEQQAIVEKTHHIASKKEMKAFVEDLSHASF